MLQIIKYVKGGKSAGHELTMIYTPAQSSDHLFLSLSKMLQGGHLLSWYHEILHAFLSSFESPTPRPNQQYKSWLMRPDIDG